MTRAAIYCRISADKEGRALGVARQEADCRALAERLGWTVVEVFTDNDTSAFSGKVRPQYRRLLEAVRTGAVTAVLAYAPDRLYRRLADLAEFIDTVTAARCQVQTVAAGEIDLSTASGRQTAKLLGVIAEGESDRTGERIRRKLAERHALGLPHGGQRPYGWEPGRTTIREPEAEVIRWGVKQTLAGVPIRTQFRELNERGVTNAGGGAWTHATYRGVITQARHAGLMRDGSPGAWPAIVTPEDHRALLRLLGDPSRVSTPGRAGKLHLLSGIARCALPGCGLPMRVGKASKGGYQVLRCYPSGHVQRRLDHVQEFVLLVIAERLRLPDARRLLAADANEGARTAREAAEQEAGRLRRVIEEAAAEHAQAGLPMRVLAAYLAPLQEQLEVAEEAATPAPDRSAVLEGLLGTDDPGAAFLALPVARQRTVIDLLVTIRIGKGPRGNVFRPDGIEIKRREV